MLRNQIIQFAARMFFEDDSEDEELVILHKACDYAEIIVPQYTDRQFQSHFRMSPTTFESVLMKLHVVKQEPYKGGNPAVDLEKQLLIAVWYLANIESFRGVSDRFGVSTSTAWHCLYRICKLLLLVNNNYRIIALPNDNQCEIIINSFRNKTGFPGIVGAVDGTHIAIKTPQQNNASYINRKGFHSVLLQGICDHKCKFIDCYAGEAGSIHDACLFRRSEIGQMLPQLRFPNNGHLLGDSAYPLTTKLLVPYKDNGHLTDIQKNYNVRHSKNRVVIEQAFALLKGRFRRLKLLEAVRLDLIPLIIISSCILHNICQDSNDILHGVNLDAEIFEERLLNPNNVENLLPHNNLAVAKIDNIANLLYMRR